eukprot:678018-Alexandrium_andersonii.AAC.1
MPPVLRSPSAAVLRRRRCPAASGSLAASGLSRGGSPSSGRSRSPVVWPRVSDMRGCFSVAPRVGAPASPTLMVFDGLGGFCLQHCTLAEGVVVDVRPRAEGGDIPLYLFEVQH